MCGGLEAAVQWPGGAVVLYCMALAERCGERRGRERRGLWYQCRRRHYHGHAGRTRRGKRCPCRLQSRVALGESDGTGVAITDGEDDAAFQAGTCQGQCTNQFAADCLQLGVLIIPRPRMLVCGAPPATISLQRHPRAPPVCPIRYGTRNAVAHCLGADEAPQLRAQPLGVGNSLCSVKRVVSYGT